MLSDYPSEARHDGLPNRVYLRRGLIVHLRMLSTPPHGDSVTIGYGTPEHSGMEFYRADSMQLPAHRANRPRLAGSEPPRMALTAHRPAIAPIEEVM